MFIHFHQQPREIKVAAICGSCSWILMNPHKSSNVPTGAATGRPWSSSNPRCSAVPPLQRAPPRRRCVAVPGGSLQWRLRQGAWDDSVPQWGCISPFITIHHIISYHIYISHVPKTSKDQRCLRFPLLKKQCDRHVSNWVPQSAALRTR